MNCRSCGSPELVPVIDLGEQYLSDFRADDEKPPRYPLVLLFCQDCSLSQLSETAPRELIYNERYGFKSGISDTMKDDLRDVVESVLELTAPESWLDIASNDGTLLSFVPEHVYRAGIDPVSKYCDEARKIADEVVCDFFSPEHFPLEFDVISAVSMFYDLDDPGEFLEGVKQVLAEDGVLVVQQNYLAHSLALGAVDNICHEHVTYFTLISLQNLLERYGLEVFDVATSSVNGGSIRTMITRTGKRTVGASVTDLMQAEVAAGLRSGEPYEAFGDKVEANLLALTLGIKQLASDGKRVYIYGASTRGATIWQAAGLDETSIACAVDRNPEKVGKMFSPIGVPIISEEEARADAPDYMLIGPWFYADEIMEREAELLANGTRAIVPLPVFEVMA